MTRKLFMFFALFAGLILSGCDLDTDQDYRIDFFRLKKTDFDSVPVPGSTFEETLAYKNALKQFSVETIEESDKRTEDYIRDFFAGKSESEAEGKRQADAAIAALNSTGNTLAVFAIVGSAQYNTRDYWAVAYFEKL